MSATGYKALGFVVWRAGRWYVRRRVQFVTPRRLAVVGFGALAAVGLLAARQSSD